ncbi:Oligopeptidase A [bioreactor metagenome]|uniref:Oligopeptidase A n=1 Tax=bioreactor metagenome TaxID=1076179 RepID=A0A644T5S9_9ZZZZ|nr:M3 family metallopeptidase [Candidatus Elulimicrobiales bacterium]
MNKNVQKGIFPDWFSVSKIQKYTKKDFDKLLKDYFENKKRVYSEIKSLKKEERNFENTVLALENCDDSFDDTFHQIGVLSISHTKKEYRDLANDFEKELSKKNVDIVYDDKIYKAILEYREGNYQKEKKSLDEKYGVGSVKLFEDICKGYKRMGFDLPKTKQKELKNTIKKLSKLSIDFSKNIDEYRDFILCSREELKGLPENFIKTLEKVEGKYKITLDYPSISPFLQYAESREKRKELVDKNYKKGGVKNLKLLSEIVELRDKKAKILGYKNHLDYRVENRMSKSEKAVYLFNNSLIKKLEKESNANIQELNEFAQKELSGYGNIKKVEYFDLAYVMNKLKEKKYSYDSAKLKEYFELEHVLKETFKIFGNIFGFVVREIDAKERVEKKINLVDKNVRLYEFSDEKSKKVLAYLMFDLFPREGKYTHAGHAKYLTGINSIPVDVLLCNFPKPTKEIPSLLSLGEVETIFHELGHALHCMLSTTNYFSQTGTNCDHDFVEVPSQLMENFLFEKKYLKKLAVHYKTKKSLDEKTLNKIIEGKNFMNGYANLRQLVLGKFDLDLHSGKIKATDSAKYYITLSKKYFNSNLPKDAIFPAGFGHLMGYDAGYYSYMWALVYAYDFYSEFEKVLKNEKRLKEIGRRYRKEILEVGGSREEMESVKRFLGRKPNNKAFLKKILEK